MKIVYENDKKTLYFIHYKVVEERNDYYGIYDIHNKLLTHTKTWKRATKLASLLQEAYCRGWNDCDWDREYDCVWEKE